MRASSEELSEAGIDTDWSFTEYNLATHSVGDEAIKLLGKFVICIRNEECEDLEPRKLYRVLPDEAAAVRLVVTDGCWISNLRSGKRCRRKI